MTARTSGGLRTNKHSAKTSGLRAGLTLQESWRSNKSTRLDAPISTPLTCQTSLYFFSLTDAFSLYRSPTYRSFGHVSLAHTRSLCRCPSPFCFIHKRGAERDDSSANVDVNCSLFIVTLGSCSRLPRFLPHPHHPICCSQVSHARRWWTRRISGSEHCRCYPRQQILTYLYGFGETSMESEGKSGSSGSVCNQVQNHNKLLTPFLNTLY